MQFLLKKIRLFSDFTDFWEFLADLWVLKVFSGLPNAIYTLLIQKKKFPIFSPLSPIFENFWPIFEFLPIFFDELLFLCLPPTVPRTSYSRQVPINIVVFYKKLEKYEKKNRISDADRHKPIPDS